MEKEIKNKAYNEALKETAPVVSQKNAQTVSERIAKAEAMEKEDTPNKRFKRAFSRSIEKHSWVLLRRALVDASLEVPELCRPDILKNFVSKIHEGYSDNGTSLLRQSGLVSNLEKYKRDVERSEKKRANYEKRKAEIMDKWNKIKELKSYNVPISTIYSIVK